MAALIVFEGGELSGKTTQSKLLYERVRRCNIPAILVHEPGTTRLGLYLRNYLVSESPSSYETEFLLFAAARAELVKTVVKPALAENQNVIADRYMDSSVAYQGYGRQLSLETINCVNEFTTQGLTPDLTVLIDVAPEVARSRLAAVQAQLPIGEQGHPESLRIDAEGTRKFEQLSLAFHQRVRAGYRKLAEQEPSRWFVVDGTDSIETINELVWQRVERLLGKGS